MTRIIPRCRRFALLILCIPLLFAGCHRSAIPAYDPAAFSCLLTVDSVSTGEAGRFTAAYVRENGQTTLTLTAPERLAGICFTLTDDGCTMTISDTCIPLSENTAASLRAMTNLLARAPEDAEDRHTEGGNTVLTFPEGQLTLNAAGFPHCLEANGRRAQVIPADPAANE